MHCVMCIQGPSRTKCSLIKIVRIFISLRTLISLSSIPKSLNMIKRTNVHKKIFPQIRSIELSEWRTESGARVYRDWAVQAALAHAHPPACARMPMSQHNNYNGEDSS